jgi:hypothetical protein
VQKSVTLGFIVKTVLCEMELELFLQRIACFFALPSRQHVPVEVNTNTIDERHRSHHQQCSVNLPFPKNKVEDARIVNPKIKEDQFNIFALFVL